MVRKARSEIGQQWNLGRWEFICVYGYWMYEYGNSNKISSINIHLFARIYGNPVKTIYLNCNWKKKTKKKTLEKSRFELAMFTYLSQSCTGLTNMKISLHFKHSNKPENEKEKEQQKNTNRNQTNWQRRRRQRRLKKKQQKYIDK